MRAKLRNQAIYCANAITAFFCFNTIGFKSNNFQIELCYVIFDCWLKRCSKPNNREFDLIFCFNTIGFTIETKNGSIKFT